MSINQRAARSAFRGWRSGSEAVAAIMQALTRDASDGSWGDGGGRSRSVPHQAAPIPMPPLAAAGAIIVPGRPVGGPPRRIKLGQPHYESPWPVPPGSIRVHLRRSAGPRAGPARTPPRCGPRSRPGRARPTGRGSGSGGRRPLGQQQAAGERKVGAHPIHVDDEGLQTVPQPSDSRTVGHQKCLQRDPFRLPVSRPRSCSWPVAPIRLAIRPGSWPVAASTEIAATGFCLCGRVDEPPRPGVPSCASPTS